MTTLRIASFVGSYTSLPRSICFRNRIGTGLLPEVVLMVLLSVIVWLFLSLPASATWTCTAMLPLSSPSSVSRLSELMFDCGFFLSWSAWNLYISAVDLTVAH
eukprot:2092592-Pyramimonas_sp.AAC.1